MKLLIMQFSPVSHHFITYYIRNMYVYMIFLMYPWTQKFCISNCLLCDSVLLHVSSLSGYHQSLREYVTYYWIVYQYGSRSVIYNLNF
jgi:hypothetical protein